MTTQEFSHIIEGREVVVHPTVLLSVVDHYSRVAKGTSKRVVGTLTGETVDGNLHISNAFAIPFEEDSKDQTLWFLDQNYNEEMFSMFRKINRKERVVGWYSTGPRVRPADLEIHETFRQYCADPVYVIVDVHPKEVGLPTTAYFSRELPTSDKVFRRTFVHVASSIGALEIEEIGVEHLLRDLKNVSTSTLSTKVHDKLSAIRALIEKLRLIASYLDEVQKGKLPANSNILYNLQSVFNLLPDLDSSDFSAALSVHTNDTLLALYLGCVVRTVMALHSLIDNKAENKRRLEAEAQKVEKSARAEEDKENNNVSSGGEAATEPTGDSKE